MDPKSVPPCLRNLSQIEEMLIARACPIMSIYRKHGGQRGRGIKDMSSIYLKMYKVSWIAFQPKYPNFLYLSFAAMVATTIMQIFQVRRDRVLTPIQWLQQNNPCYTDITINRANIQLLPLDGIPEELLCVQESDDSDNQEDESDDVQQDTRSFLPLPLSQLTEEAAISSTINGVEPLDWPQI